MHMTVADVIRHLQEMPQDALMVNAKPTSRNTLLPILTIGTKTVIPVYGRLVGESEFREPQNSHDEPKTPRQIVVSIR